MVIIEMHAPRRADRAGVKGRRRRVDGTRPRAFVAPGTYRVQFFKRVQGARSALTQPAPFDVRILGGGDYLVELIKSVVLVVLVALIYMVINNVLIRVFDMPATAVPLPGEPILFGLFYVLVFVLFEKITAMIKQVILNMKDGRA